MYLITGVAGFIGSNLAKYYLDRGETVYGVDNLNDYYSVDLKKDRLKRLNSFDKFHFFNVDLCDYKSLKQIFDTYRISMVINLAAQAGVRYSLENPDAYIESNIVGFHNILKLSKEFGIDKLLYASSSSVYGGNKKVPFEESDNVDHPVSLYAASKKTNELMAEVYSHLYDIKCYGLRFFTVYGPMGRPDMAYFSFLDRYFKDEPIHIYNNGDFKYDLYRDFTYIDDIVEGIAKLSKTSIDSNHEIFNIGNNQPTKLMDFIYTLESCLSNSLGEEISFKKVFEPIKPGDVKATHANTDKLYKITGFKPSTSLNIGLQHFTDWYVTYYDYK
ncbi:NAD-dependent epimerase [Erysipelothrix larvae]|uniref:NAD-dependent epimerase n=1 Tax=Erysipelothrix larvae TaxID=1514105 RepID=A0A120JTU9_9FIRM|nr:GDP-mannose 4,6-dehydratase [Erysipelothrix larvae]AMC94007.1 NAD-dependent epimerase [Erysipelothrix larvae]